jgi:hypothetical protein
MHEPIMHPNVIAQHIDHLMLRAALRKAVSTLEQRLATHPWALQTITHTLATY